MAVSKSEQRSSELLDQLTPTVFESDVNSSICRTNRIGLDTFGHSVPDLDKESSVFEMSASQNVGWNGEKIVKLLRERTGTGKEVWEKTFDAVPDSLMVVDVSHKVIRAKEAAELHIQSERVKDVAEMATGMAHNFNNLLQIVTGSAMLALNALEIGNASSVKSCLNQILQTSKLGSETVKRFQIFARQDNDMLESDARVFDLSETVKQAVEMSKVWWKTRAEKSGIRIDLSTNLGEECRLCGNESELFEVVLNLIKNAVEALPKGGEIRLQTSAREDQVLLEVTDTGVGIPPDHLDKVFEPFFTTKGLQSTGVGLSSSHGIINRHGGTISVESRPCVGTKFSVKLPLAGEPTGNANLSRTPCA